VPGQHSDLSVFDPGADAVAVDLYLVEPLVAFGRALDQLGELGLDEIGKGLGRTAGH